MLKREIAAAIRSEMRAGKVMLLYGARRVGKTVLIRQLYPDATYQVINKTNIFDFI